jgi:lysophospholipid acyltransferase (LPLAT)-like uncharacterized protein
MAISKEVKYLLLNKFLTPPIFHLFNLYARTLRVQYDGVETIQKYVDDGGRVIIASWHQRFFGGFFLPKIFKQSPCIMISQSRDGDFISNVVQRIGWVPVRGSSTRGGKNALEKMVQGVMQQGIGGHIVDGPNGPPRMIKPGIISLARRSGAAICPGFVSYENAWNFNSWDRFMVPKPFSRVIFRTGSLIFAPEELDGQLFDTFRRQLEQEMISGYEALDSHWKR